MISATIDRKLKHQREFRHLSRSKGRPKPGYLLKQRIPIDWKGIDSDNGQEFINQILYKYCQREGLKFTRSRENKKNNNAYIEEKNWTHVMFLNFCILFSLEKHFWGKSYALQFPTRSGDKHFVSGDSRVFADGAKNSLD